MTQTSLFHRCRPRFWKNIHHFRAHKRMLSSAGGKPFLLLTFTNTAVNSFQAKLTSYETFDIEANRRLTQSRVLTFDSFINAYLARPLASYLWPDIKYRFVPSFERIPNSRIPTPSNGKSTVNIQHFEPDGTYKGNKNRSNGGLKIRTSPTLLPTPIIKSFAKGPGRANSSALN